MFEIMPNLDSSSNIPLYIQLYNYIKKEIQLKAVPFGTKLPSKRKLSAYLKISQNTIQAAYDQLTAEGYVESKPRSGVFVSMIDDDLFSESSVQHNMYSNDMPHSGYNYILDFNSGHIDIDIFPFSTWRKLSIQSLFPEKNSLLLIGDAQGELPLREEIAKYVFQSRGVKCSSDQIILGTGTQYLISLLCLIIGRQHNYAIENPGFHRVRNIFLDNTVNLIPISLDKQGISVDELKNSSADIVYVTPSHQFPLGTIMPISRRLEILKWCHERKGYIIEDDYDGEFRYSGKPIPSLQSLDSYEQVIYMGTFSKSLIPSIRISYMILPTELYKIYRNSYYTYKQTVSRFHQDTLYEFMAEGYWARHLNKMRNLYRKKHKLLLDSIKCYMDERVKIIGENSGLHILLEVNNAMSEKQLLEAAAQEGIKVYPTSIYYTGEDTSVIPKILIGFGGIKYNKIDQGIKLLSKAWLQK